MDAKEILMKIREQVGSPMSSLGFWFKQYRPWVLSGLTLVGILLVVWARFGFSVEVGRFFAAESQEGSLTVSCSLAGNVLTWTRDSSANSNGVERGNTGAKNLSECADYWCWLPSSGFDHQVPSTNTPATYTDTQLQQDMCYQYRVKYQPQLPSNSVFCPTNCNISATPTPTPTPIPSGSPIPETLECAPASQTVNIGQTASFVASGGQGTSYSWDADGIDFVTAPTGPSFSVMYESPGTYGVRVTAIGGAGDEEVQPTTTCTVIVEDQTACTEEAKQCPGGSFVGRVAPSCEFAACPAVPLGNLSLLAEVRNFTNNTAYAPTALGRPAQQFQIRTVVAPATDTSVANVFVRVPLPDSLVYVDGSTAVEGSPTAVDTVTTSGIGLGTLSGSNQITFVVRARGAGDLPSGTLTSIVPAVASGDGVRDVSGQVAVLINNAPVVTRVTPVETGPSETTLLALLGAALATLLYVSYARTGSYRQREISSITRKRDPLDFQN